MIVKDEELTLARCLGCVQPFADEIVIVDTGSSDGTAVVARNYTEKVFSFAWCDDFSAARNFSFSKASCDLVMWLDADDVVAEEDVRRICALKDEMENYDVAMLLYAAAFSGGRPAFEYYRERIFRRSFGFEWKGAVHEAVEPRGRIVWSDAVIRHEKVRPPQPMRNLRIYQGLIASGKPLAPRDLFYYGRELYFNNMHAECAAVLERYLKGEGWEQNRAEACLTLHAAYSALGDQDRAVAALLRSFSVSAPDGRACCMLGERLLEAGNLAAAKFWYETAMRIPRDLKNGAFFQSDYCDFIPCMQLCVINYRLGDAVAAERFNGLAAEIKPDDERVVQNMHFFRSLKGGKL